MSYTINLTNGNVFAVIPDGTINTSSSMTLIGKNYAGYGDFLDENFIHLLENSANNTAPGAPLVGQLWWDSANTLLKVYNGTTFKTISAATSSATAPTSNVTGDLWYDTVNQQLKVYTGSTWLLVGPQFTAGQGVTGAVVDTITDNLNQTHTVIKLYVSDSVVGIVSKDATFTPSPAITGFSGGVKPGITLSSSISSIPQLFQGTATSAQSLIYGNTTYLPTDFIPSVGNATMTGTLSILNNSGLSVGVNNDLRVTVSGTAVTIANQTTNGNINFKVATGNGVVTAMTINGTNGYITGTSIQANYADVAERFEADTILEAGTVVELGGSAEITRSTEELSDKVFGVISTRAAYLMNGNAGTDATHPPVAMTGRVPVRVVGAVHKGDRLVSAGNGLARSAQASEITAFNVIGRALVDKLDSDEGMVEAIVTIK